MEPGTDCVFYDTGDILVTTQRVAYRSVSVPLAEITAARIVEQPVLVPPGRPSPTAVLVVSATAALLCFFSYAGFVVMGKGPQRITYESLAAFLAVGVAVTWLSARWQAAPNMVPGWAVLLVGQGQEGVLLHTRCHRKAVRVAEAINRAVALVSASRLPLSRSPS